jgi:multiple sugar transport system permease protein
MLRTPSRAWSFSAFWMVLPFVIGIVAFTLVPLCIIVWATTQDWNLLGQPAPIDIQKWLDSLVEPRFLHSVGVTALLVVLVVPAQLVLSISLAIALARTRAAPVLRPLFVLPWVISPIVVGLSWRWIVSPIDGPLAAVSGLQLDPMESPVGALLIVALVLIWNNIGYMSLFFSAALALIPRELREGAILDGAGEVAVTRYIVLPLLTPVIAFVALTSLASTSAVFDQVYGLSGGGPGTSTEVVGMRIFIEGFTLFDTRQAAVAALAALAFSIPMLVAMKRRLRAVR